MTSRLSVCIAPRTSRSPAAVRACQAAFFAMIAARP